MRFLLLAAVAFLPVPAMAQYAPYGVTTYPGVGQAGLYGAYGAAPNAGLGGYGYNGYSGGAYGTGNGGYGYGAQGYGPQGPAGYGYGDPYAANNGLNGVGSAYAVPGQTGPGGAVPRPGDDVMTLGRVRNDGTSTAGGTSPPTIGLPNGAGAVAQKPDPKGQRIEGVAHVIDGNTLAVSGEVIVLDGADAPETGQTCTDKSGLEWRCGQRATSKLVAFAEGRHVVCTGRTAAGTAILATCLWGTTNLAKAMVAEGWAMSPRAASALYVADESAAKADQRGIWNGSLTAPWTYRAGH